MKNASEHKHTILFSPVGRTDPISNNHDGALLHICRHYKVNRVVLYLSKEMAENERRDNRYTESINRLAKELGHEIELEVEKNLNLENVHLFDTFYDAFDQILHRLNDDYPEAHILLNLSSGTPAMKEALHTLAAYSDKPYEGIQVSSPKRREEIASKAAEEFSLDEKWEDNDDSKPGEPSRCKTAQDFSLVNRIKRNAMSELVNNYDYGGALKIAKTLKKHLQSTPAVLLIESAAKRKQLQLQDASTKLCEIVRDMISDDEWDEICSTFYIEKRNASEEEERTTLLREYLLVLHQKEELEEYADFLRMLTPALFDILDLYLCRNLHVNSKLYCKENKKGTLQLNRNSLDNIDDNGRQWLAYLDGEWNGRFNTGAYTSVHAFVFIKRYLLAHEESSKERNLFERLRNVEVKARNPAAHEICSMTKEDVHNLTGQYPINIRGDIKKAAELIGVIKQSEGWGVYKKMNDIINKHLEKMFVHASA